MMGTKEEAFFGVKNTVEAPSDETEPVDEINVEVVDDTPEEDQPYVNKEDDDDGSEIKKVGGRAQRRIQKLKAEYHAERREKEKAQRLSNEAVFATERLHRENQRLLEIVKKSQTAINDQSALRADSDIKFAQEQYRKALDLEDKDAIVEAQKNLTSAQMARQGASGVSDELLDQWVQEMGPIQQPRQPEPQQQLETAQPEPKAVEWQEKNQWFGVDEEMTSLAYGIHDKLIREGVDPESDEYYNSIDGRMREIFPSRFNNDNDANDSDGVVINIEERQAAHPVVAPAKRGKRAQPRTITMTTTQVRLAKRLGLSPQQYAAQLLKENS